LNTDDGIATNAAFGGLFRKRDRGAVEDDHDVAAIPSF